jgi:DNA-binding transcriptional MerR regulator
VSGSGGTAARWDGPGVPAGAEDTLMSIGEVLSQLRPDFPDTTISKLRFLETEGLVEPRRTPSGYRKYTWSDVRRLRYILTAQRDHYLPLRVIRDHLAAIDRGETPTGPRLALVAVASAPEQPRPVEDTRVSRAELLARAGVAESLLQDLERHGLVGPGGSGYYPADAVEVVTAAGALAEYGIEARHLRAYRAAADREVGLFEQLTAPLVRSSSPAARARAADTVRELSALTQRLHAALVRMGLSDTLGR